MHGCLLKIFAKKLCEFITYLSNVFWHVVCLYMGCSGDEEQFLIIGARGVAEALFRHVECVGVATGNHKKRFIDKMHSLGSIPVHQVNETAFGVTERGIGMTVVDHIVVIPLTV